MILCRSSLAEPGAPRGFGPAGFKGRLAFRARRWPLTWTQRFVACAVAPLALLFTSGATVVHQTYTPSAAAVRVPAEVVADFFIVEAHVAGKGPFRFLVDTGSSVSLVSPALAATLPAAGSLAVTNASQNRATLPGVVVPRLELGRAIFSDVSAAVFDFGDLSRQLGRRVDGVIGFPLFRHVVFTIDYPARQLVIDPRGRLSPQDDATVDCYGDGGLPLATVEVGGQRVVALIDTGSDAALTVNAAAPSANLVRDLRRGSVRATVTGDEPQLVGRLETDVRIGTHRVAQPVVEVADGLPALGNGVLKHFAVTFDPRQQLMALRRTDDTAIRVPAQRSVGLGFVRGENDWRVAAIVPDTRAEEIELREGDRCVRINGEPTLRWPLERYQELLRRNDAVTFTFASATGRELDVRLPVIDLVR